MSAWLRKVTIFVCMAVIRVAFGQDETVEWRLEHIAGVKSDTAKAFFTTLQRNVVNGDRRAVCALIEYPLRQSTGSIRSARVCQSHYLKIFTKDVVDAVASQRFDQLLVNSGGIMVGLGQVWFSGLCRDDGCRRVEIRIIGINNAHDIKEAASPRKGHVLFSCRADGQSIQVSADGSGGVMCRAWRSGRSFSTPPDLQIPRGTQTVEGSSGCVHRIWSFSDRAVTYSLSELGCFPDSNPPPKGATGQFILNPDTSREKVLWCF
jgi:hypothetical protein